MDYKGVACPACTEAFTDESDVVVCPVCGTPHHRACYEHTGNCANAPLHEDGFVFTVPDMPSFEDAAKPESANTYSVEAEDKPEKTNPFRNTVLNPTSAEYGWYGGVPVSPDTKIGECTARELGEYLKEDTARFVPRFILLKSMSKKFSWNIFAFFFPFAWAAQKRMFKTAIVLLAISLLFTGVQIYDMVTRDSARAFADFYMQAAEDAVLTTEEANKISVLLDAWSNELYTQPSENVVTAFLVNFGIVDNVIFALFATYLYMRDAEKKAVILRNSKLTAGVNPNTLSVLGKGRYLFMLSGWFIRACFALGIADFLLFK